jgi:putative transcriptional regulator
MTEGRKTREPLGTRLKTALEEGLEYARGQRDLRTQFVPYPPARDYSGPDVAAVRKRLGLSQSAWARCLMVSLRTLQSWEQGVRKPSRPAMRLIQVFDQPRTFSGLLDRLPAEEPSKYAPVRVPAPAVRERKRS